MENNEELKGNFENVVKFLSNPPPFRKNYEYLITFTTKRKWGSTRRNRVECRADNIGIFISQIHRVGGTITSIE